MGWCCWNINPKVGILPPVKGLKHKQQLVTKRFCQEIILPSKKNTVRNTPAGGELQGRLQLSECSVSRGPRAACPRTATLLCSPSSGNALGPRMELGKHIPATSVPGDQGSASPQVPPWAPLGDAPSLCGKGEQILGGFPSPSALPCICSRRSAPLGISWHTCTGPLAW